MKEGQPSDYQFKHNKRIHLDSYKGAASDLMELNMVDTDRSLLRGRFASENISRFIPFPRLKMDITSIALAGALVSGCGAPVSPSGGIRSDGSTCPPQGYHIERIAKENPTPTSQEIARGREFRKDIVRVAQQFIGVQFLQQGIKYDSDSANHPDYANTAWARSCYKDSVIENVATWVRSHQSFMIANTYDIKGKVVETHISAGRMAVPIYNIDLRNLPGFPEAYRTHPHNVPNSKMEEEGFGYIPPERLEEVTRTVFNVPSGVSFQLAEVCYTMPFSNNLYREPALIGTGFMTDGRYIRIRVSEGAGALLLVTDPKLGQPSVPGLCGP